MAGGVAILTPVLGIALLIRRHIIVSTLEFDYFVIGGKFRIVKVISRRKRKLLLEIPFSSFQSVGKLDSDSYTRYAAARDIKKKFAVGNYDDESKIFYAYYTTGDEKNLLHFEPNVEFMIAFKRSLPRVAVMDKSALNQL